MRKQHFRAIWILALALPYVGLADATVTSMPEAMDEAVVVEAVPVQNTTDVGAQLIRLDQQLQHLQQEDYLAKIAQLQQEIQSLRGVVDMQAHDLQLIKQRLSEQHVVAQSASSVVSHPPAISVEKTEVTQYQAAFSYLKSRDYAKAIRLFNQFLSDYPQGKYSPNAHYWLGEIYLLQGQYALAESNLRQVIEQHEGHNKTPDAMLKLAMVYINTQQPEQAKVLVSQLSAKYPDTTAAKMAKIQLGNVQH